MALTSRRVPVSDRAILLMKGRLGDLSELDSHGEELCRMPVHASNEPWKTSMASGTVSVSSTIRD